MVLRIVHRVAAPFAAAAVLLCAAGAAHAQSDKAAERAQRRAQMQAQALQQQLQEAQAARGKVEAERAELLKHQENDRAALARAQSAERRLGGEMKSAQSERAALAQRVTELERELAEGKRAADEALQAKERELAQARSQHEQEHSDLQGRFADQVRRVTECTDKNQHLAQLSLELMDRYRDKGVVDALKQRDPLLGLSDVQMFNVLQEYRDRADALRFKPSSSR